MDSSIGDDLDLSRQKLKKISKYTTQEAQNITSLVLDDNELQRLENLDSFARLQKLSVVKNQLLRMYGLCRLHSLHTLNLAHNGILTIEGLKELVNLKWLCLAGNTIKTIEHLNTNLALEHVDLSENNITHINDLSYLKSLKELLLHNNKINHLRQCERFLPNSLTILTLANNNVEDLNEISQIVHLNEVNSISIANNPCVTLSFNTIGFDYRPFVINWCLNVKTIDGYVVDAIESLRAEWLYSQGRGRHFRIGDHKELVQYLASVCPPTGEALETEEDRKLRIILSKAQHHQQQLREQSFDSPTPSPVSRKKLHGAKNSPRLNSSRSRLRSPDRMTSSFYASPNSNANDQTGIMSQSFDPSMLHRKCDEFVAEAVNSPLQALSKMVPVPENLMSPDLRPANAIIPLQQQIESGKMIGGKVGKLRSPKMIPKMGTAPKNRLLAEENGERRKRGSSPSLGSVRKPIANGNSSNKPSILRKSSSSEDESEMQIAKLDLIQLKASQKQRQSAPPPAGDVHAAATTVQKWWRGHLARHRNKEVRAVYRALRADRAAAHIAQLSVDMATTKAALESERKIQMLQTEAISALWKQMSSLGGAEAGGVGELARTCAALQTQVEALQGAVREVVRAVGGGGGGERGMGTQTEIVAVRTPGEEEGRGWVYRRRPQSLQLEGAEGPEGDKGEVEGGKVD